MILFDKKGKRTSRMGMIKAKMIAQCGGQQGFMEAKAAGDIWEKTNPKTGKTLWYHDEEEEYEDEGMEDNTTLNSGQRKLTNEQAVALKAVNHLEYNVEIDFYKKIL